jgi:hypothetical protein
VAAPAHARPRRSLTRPILFALLPVALVAGGYYYVVGGQVMTTDNAYVQAQSLGVSTAKAGNSSSAIRKLAISELPIPDLSAEAAAKVNGVLSNVAMFRRLPTLTFEVDPEVYGYFLRNPDVAVSTWRASAAEHCASASARRRCA